MSFPPVPYMWPHPFSSENPQIVYQRPRAVTCEYKVTITVIENPAKQHFYCPTDKTNYCLYCAWVHHSRGPLFVAKKFN